MSDNPTPPVPGWLAKYPRAVEQWETLWPCLERTRIKPAMHGMIVAQYCVAYSNMRDALERLERGKLVAEKRTVGVGAKANTTIEKVTVSPYQAIYDNATREMDRLGRMLGLDPLNPLEATRCFADYAAILCDDGDDYVDDGNDSDGGSAGDAGSDTGGQDALQAPPAGAEKVLDG